MDEQEFLNRLQSMSPDQLRMVSIKIRELQVEYLTEIFNSLDVEDRIDLIDHVRGIVSKRYTEWIEHEEVEGKDEISD
jgi:hypothetical protein